MVDRIEGDKLIEGIGALMERIRAYEFPQLEVTEVEDDGETWQDLRCPRCGHLVDMDELYVVDFSERWSRASEDINFDHRRLLFFNDGEDDYGENVYYRHDDHAVRLPDGWKGQS